jgi:hypothetical protein
MYRNFSITEEEKKQILEMHTTNGYKRSLNEQPEDKNISGKLWNKFVSVMLTMVPKPTHDVFKTGQSLNWGNKPSYRWNMSILKGDEEYPEHTTRGMPTSIMVAVDKSNMGSLKEMINFFKVKGYNLKNYSSEDSMIEIDIPVNSIDFEKVKNDITDFFNTFQR